MDRTFEDRNSDSRVQLQAVADRLSDDQLHRPIDGPWTTGALLAHIAFWDRFVGERWGHSERSSTGTPLPIDDKILDLVNDAALPHWLALPPRQTAEDCLAAAEALDRQIRSLHDDVVWEVLREGRERLLNRSLHRADHLRTIETAFANSLRPRGAAPSGTPGERRGGTEVR